MAKSKGKVKRWTAGDVIKKRFHKHTMNARKRFHRWVERNIDAGFDVVEAWVKREMGPVIEELLHGAENRAQADRKAWINEVNRQALETERKLVEEFGVDTTKAYDGAPSLTKFLHERAQPPRPGTYREDDRKPGKNKPEPEGVEEFEYEGGTPGRPGGRTRTKGEDAQRWGRWKTIGE